MTRVVLDTHAVLWWTLEPARLGRTVAARITHAQHVGVPSIVFWEVSLLVRKGRLALQMPVAEWATKLCSIPRVVSLPLTRGIALLADTLEMHADPADRFIVATALAHSAPLATKDELLRQLRFVETIW
ncbi:MAG: type II toxin-antitoxin system VapC family toxin [Myxococcota bacterium]